MPLLGRDGAVSRSTHAGLEAAGPDRSNRARWWRSITPKAIADTEPIG